VAKSVLSIEDYWGEDLTHVENLTEAIAFALKEIETNGIEKGFANYSQQF
jgi:tagaturonate reductase